MKNLKVFIFSFNRGPLLENCINSALECLKVCQIYVVDDLSTDPETLSVLRKLPAEVKLIQPKSGVKERHGGLYENMNSALSLCNDDDLALFVQDDMQFVRPLLESDVSQMEVYFRSNNSPFLYPVFLKLSNYDSLSLRLQESLDIYESYDDQILTGAYYSDVVVVNVRMLRNSGWAFLNGELENARLAKTMFHKMAYMVNPFLMYLPSPPVFRTGSKNLVISIFEVIFRFGFHPIKIMSEDENSIFCGRNKSVLPVAENFLSARIGGGSKPWIYSVFDVHPIVYPLYNISRKPIYYLGYYFQRHVIGRF